MKTIANYFNLLRLNYALEAGANTINVLNSIHDKATVQEICDSELLPGQRLYICHTDDRVALFVMLDNNCAGEQELADERPFNDEAPLYFSSSSHRVSPVFLMKTIAEKVHDMYDTAYYFMLTSSSILNREEMVNVDEKEEIKLCWDENELVVQDDFDFERETKALHCAIEMKTSGDEIAIEPENEAEDKPETKDDDADETVEASEATEDDDDVDTDDDDWDILLENFFSEDTVVDDFIDNTEAQMKADEEKKAAANPNVFNPEIGDWKEYVDEEDTDFYEITPVGVGETVKKQLFVAPCTIYKTINNADTLLGNMVGLSQMKGHISELVDFAKYNEMLHGLTGMSHDITLHSVFTGNPGTGKTTLASILGSLLKEAGVLSKGHVVMCNRASFCSGTHWGDEERAVTQLVKIAQGGVLFVDEAYNLISDNKNDPGFQVLPNLLTMLADEKMRDICVVLAGYPKEMKQLIDTNPGIASRFPHHFDFRDYTVDELMQITQMKLKKFGYHFTPAARQAFCGVLKKMYDARDKKTWGNARAVVNLLEQTYLQHAMRIMKSKDTNLLRLKLVDIPQKPQVATNLPSRNKIGFNAM